MKFFLLGFYTAFHLVHIARAKNGNNHEISSEDEVTETCDWAQNVSEILQNEQKVKNYFQELNNISLNSTYLKVTRLCSTFKVDSSNIGSDITIHVQGCITYRNNQMVNFTSFGNCSEHIQDSLPVLMLSKGTGSPNSQHDCSCKRCPTCTPCTSSSSLSSSSTTKTTATPTSRKGPSETSSISTTMSTKIMPPATNTSPPSSSRNTVPFRTNTDECEEPQGVSYTSAVIIGLASFFAGMAVVLLCFWILYLKRSSKLCFTKPEKAPEKLTSDRVTKKVLAKHMLSATKDTTVTNAVYFKNETKDMNTATGTNNKLPTSEGQGHLNTAKNGNKGNSTHGMNMNQDQNENGSQVYTTLQETEIGKPNIRAHEQTDDEHVYRELDLDHKVDINYPKGDHNNVKGKGQLGIPGKTDSDVFDHTRESAVSNHDYFVLQNENFRSSHQPGTQVSQSELSNEGNQMEHPGDTENTYFKLERQ